MKSQTKKNRIVIPELSKLSFNIVKKIRPKE